ncbi:MAG TPA: pitrilysin family protein [Gemmatimonadaceae bacterium]|nr:pitrilysin family protein [Gemmatimonadaceae bacterium]
MRNERKTARTFTASGRIYLIAVLASAFAAAHPAEAQRSELERFIQRKTLANGLEVIVIENHGVPIVTVEAVVKNGSFTQSPEYEGLAHLYEHMFFKANDDYPDPDGVMNRASMLGAIFNAETHEEMVNYYLTVPSDSLQGAMQLLSSALQRPRFLASELAREKTVVLGEYDRAESEPFWHIDQAMSKVLWGSQFSRKNTIGSRSVISRVTPEQMRVIQRKYYVPNNTALIIAGDVKPADAFARAEQLFASWPRGANPFVADPIPPIPPLTSDAAVIVEKDVTGVSVLIQWHGPSVNKDPQATFVADVYSDYLNLEGSTFQRALVDSDLWQAVLVNYYTLDHIGPITVSGQTTPEKLREAIPAMLRELKRTIEPGYFTAEKLEEVKAHRSTSSAFGRERTSSFAHTLAFWWSVAGTEYYMKYVDEMAKQTAADLASYARRYLIDRPHVTGALLNAETRRRIQLTPDMLTNLAVWR